MRGDDCVSEFGLLSTYFLIYRPRSGPGEAEDQTGTRCGYLAVTPAGTVRLHTLYLCSVHTRHSTATTRQSKLVTFPIIKDLQTFTQTIICSTVAVYIAGTILNSAVQEFVKVSSKQSYLVISEIKQSVIEIFRYDVTL